MSRIVWQFWREIKKMLKTNPLFKTGYQDLNTAKKKLAEWTDAISERVRTPHIGQSLQPLMRRKLIFDVGMCDGADTAYYLAKGFRVVAIEANPALVSKAKQTFSAEIQRGELIIVDKAIGKSAGTVQFGVHRTKEEWSSTDPDRLIRMGDEMQIIDVECVTLDSIMVQYGSPYYLKIDIEGADLSAVEAIGCVKERPPYVSAEAHSRLIAERLYEFGYRRFMLVDQASRYVPQKLWFKREGRYVPMRFSDRHSGPFGREVPGRRLSIDRVLKEYDDKVDAGTLTWHDFHAAR
jgi:FkbM family methyltransferase